MLRRWLDSESEVEDDPEDSIIHRISEESQKPKKALRDKKHK